jgi:hypothetical protein
VPAARPPARRRSRTQPPCPASPATCLAREQDRNGDGVLDLSDVAGLAEELAGAEKDRRLLRWVAAIVGLAALLMAAATPGLACAVVELNKDVGVENAALVASGSGAALETGVNLRPASAADLLGAADPDAALARVTRVVVPEPGGGLTVQRVGAAAALAGGWVVRLRTAVGGEVDLPAARATAPRPPGRRLFTCTSESECRADCGAAGGCRVLGPSDFDSNGCELACLSDCEEDPSAPGKGRPLITPEMVIS